MTFPGRRRDPSEDSRALPRSTSPLPWPGAGPSAIAGAALTCYAGPDDALAILAAFEIAQPGDVIVAATEAFKGSAVVGDLFAAMAVSAAVTAIVTDGLARDCDGIIATGLPVFASGISPNSVSR